MFNLEDKISEWQKQMLSAGIKTPVPLEELELHLREDIEQLVRSGRTEQEAFDLAIQRMGQAPLVEGEFKKIAPADDRLNWRLIEILSGFLASAIPLWFCTALILKAGAFADLTASQRISGLAAIGLFTLFAWGGRLGYKWFPVVPGKRQRGIITVSCAVPVMLWWIAFLNFIAPRHDFTLVQLLITILWVMITPAGIMMGLTWGIEAAARKRTTAVVVS